MYLNKFPYSVNAIQLIDANMVELSKIDGLVLFVTLDQDGNLFTHGILYDLNGSSEFSAGERFSYGDWLVTWYVDGKHHMRILTDDQFSLVFRNDTLAVESSQT